ncbi:uncharacterized protein LOC127370936 [Dicentrarchus labrax]|uniref:uncharacterized protein LOC127370936 n=1 Tax=Dicentrarchus labrax TaxID=13489 RepID=UPI0021F6662A|nr:uncharacterized protein LOC127370936 [Dicentrarchus labrax]
MLWINGGFAKMMSFLRIMNSSNYSKLCHKKSHLAIQDISREEVQEDQAEQVLRICVFHTSEEDEGASDTDVSIVIEGTEEPLGLSTRDTKRQFPHSVSRNPLSSLLHRAIHPFIDPPTDLHSSYLHSSDLIHPSFLRPHPSLIPPTSSIPHSSDLIHPSFLRPHPSLIPPTSSIPHSSDLIHPSLIPLTSSIPHSSDLIHPSSLKPTSIPHPPTFIPRTYLHPSSLEPTFIPHPSNHPSNLPSSLEPTFIPHPSNLPSSLESPLIPQYTTLVHICSLCAINVSYFIHVMAWSLLVKLLFGRTPQGVLDVVNESWEEGQSPSIKEVQYVLDLRAKLHTLGQLSQENLLRAQERQQRLYRGTRLRRFAPRDKVLVLLPSSSSKLLAKRQRPFVVTRRVGDVDYEVVRSDRREATQIYHLNLLKVWREAENVSMVTTVKERDDLGPEVPKSTNPALLHCDDHLTLSQRADIAVLQQRFADVFSPLPRRTSLIQHHVETHPGVTMRSQPYRLPEHKRKVAQKELKAMLEMGVVEESNSAWCRPIALVLKKDGAIVSTIMDTKILILIS